MFETRVRRAFGLHKHQFHEMWKNDYDVDTQEFRPRDLPGYVRYVFRFTDETVSDLGDILYWKRFQKTDLWRNFEGRCNLDYPGDDVLCFWVKGNVWVIRMVLSDTVVEGLPDPCIVTACPSNHSWLVFCPIAAFFPQGPAFEE